LAIVLPAALAASACATTISGETQKVELTSDPPGATVEVEPGWYEVKTPIGLVVKRKDGPLRLTFTMEGYEPYRAQVRATTNPWTLGNFALLAFVTWGIQIDDESGAEVSLSPAAIHASLVKASHE
jgi:hypothetical protein